MKLTKEFRFEASHVLPLHPGKCSRLHGHSWVLYVSVEGEVNSSTGFVQDYADISAIVKPLVEQLDHHHLGQWVGSHTEHCAPTQAHPDYIKKHGVLDLPPMFYPSSENLLHWIAGQLFVKLNWSELELKETCTSSAILSRAEFQRSIILT